MLQRYPFCCFMLCAAMAHGQAIGLRGLGETGSRTVSLQYQNDAFGNTDYYYSQGVQLAFATPALHASFLKTLVLTGKAMPAAIGIAVEHDAYTPTSILSDSMLKGDRPYAACLLVSLYARRMLRPGQLQLSTMLSVGIIGPAAGGEALQTYIHRRTNNDLPHGWQFQIGNDLALSYTLKLDQRLFGLSRFFEANAFGGVTVGTLNDQLFAGLQLRAGLMDPLFTNDEQGAVRLYADNATSVQLVGYDATLQGGWLNRSSPYTIAASGLQRVVLRNTFSLHAGYGRLTATGSFTWLGKELMEGRSHAWGGLQLSCRL